MNILAIVGAAMIGGTVQSVMPPIQRAIAYPLNRLLPNEVMQIADAVELRKRKHWEDGDLIAELKNYGLNEGRIQNLVLLSKQLIGLQELITLYRREKIAEDNLYKEAERLGFDKAVTSLIVTATEYIPNVQDIIRFAVREVYSPEIAGKFGQFEGGNEVAKAAEKDLKAIGMSPDVLLKYWGAHWDLPSPQMGYEMLHRGVITIDELEMLLRALDVMPFWRDKLIQISYSPLTRVDVRRMHKLGIINETDLLTAYQSLGYDATNAKRLADFTVKYNADSEESEQTASDKDKIKERDLSKADILAGYIDGLFTKGETTEGLTALGYATDEIDYYIAKAEYQKANEMINKYLKLYHDLYVSGTKEHDEVIDALTKLNLPGEQIENLFKLWDVERANRIQHPTKAELLAFLRQGIIAKDRCMTELKKLGYAQEYIDWYMQTVKTSAGSPE